MKISKKSKKTYDGMLKTTGKPNQASDRSKRLNDLKKNHKARGGKGQDYGQ